MLDSRHLDNSDTHVYSNKKARRDVLFLLH